MVGRIGLSFGIVGEGQVECRPLRDLAPRRLNRIVTP